MRSLLQAAALAVLLLVPTASAQVVSPDASFDALAVQAAADGEVRVIVTLAVDVRPEGGQSHLGIQAQRSAIANAQEFVLASLASPAGVKRFQTVPGVAMRVGPADLARLRASSAVVQIAEDLLLEAHALPTVRRSRLDGSLSAIGVPAVHALGVNGANTSVAILDTGVERGHTFFSGGFGSRVVEEACFSEGATDTVSLCPGGQSQEVGQGSAADCDAYTGCGHGTHVAGIAAGQRTGASGPASGVAPGADIVAVQVFHGNTVSGKALAASSDIILGLEFVHGLVMNGVSPVASVNMSLGGGNYTESCDSLSPPMTLAIENLLSAGVATVISSGNDGYQAATGFPGCITSAVTVGSVSKEDAVASSSNIAPWMDVFAPGVSILSSVTGGGFGTKSGTSMAAPHVAGAFALLRQAYPAETPTETVARLVDTGVDIDAGSPVAPYRRIQVDAALSPPSAGLTESSLGATLSAGEQATASFRLRNGVGAGAGVLAWTVELENMTPVGTPPANACASGQVLEQGSRTTYSNLKAGGLETGQSFSATCTGAVSSIAVAVYNTAAGEAWAGVLRVYDGAGTAGTEVATVPVSGVNPSAESYHEMVLDLPLEVMAGDVLTFMLDLTSTEATGVPILYHNADPYADGVRYQTANGSPGSATAQAGSDLNFKVTYAAPGEWARMTTASGVLAAGEISDIEVAFSAVGVPDGTYTADLVVATNDPSQRTVTLPVMLVVGAGATVAMTVDGPDGYYFFGPPSAGITPADLATINLVRGIPGFWRNAPAPTFWTTYDNTTTEWSIPSNPHTALPLGRAFRWRLYDRDDLGDPAKTASVAHPFALTSAVAEPAYINTEDVTVTMDTNGARFNYLANPFGTTLALDRMGEWDGAAHVYDIVWVFDYASLSWVRGGTEVPAWGAFRVRAKPELPSGNPRALTIPAWAAGIGDSPQPFAGASATLAQAAETSLGAPRPNPSAGRVAVHFVVATAGEARVSVIDVRGREVAVLADGWVTSGAHETVLDGAGLAAGVYVIRLETADGVHTRTAAVVR